MPAFRDLTQEPPFGRLTVLRRATTIHKRTYWVCQCTCGNTPTVMATNLTKGFTQSCGCLHKERISQSRKIHGMARSPEYNVWMNMRDRCLNPKNTSYKNYGGRGITVCQQWVNSFETFLQDMGCRQSLKYTLERKDNDGPYSKDNCIWTTRLTQSHNKRNNHYITYQGRTQCIAAWVKELHIPPGALFRSLKAGMSDEQAMVAAIAAKRRPYRRKLMVQLTLF